MELARFVIDKVIDEGPTRTICIDMLGFEIKNRDHCMYNIRPFQLEIDENGIIHNYNEQVMFSIYDNVKRKIKIDTIHIDSIVNHSVVQRKINELTNEINKLIGVNKSVPLDAAHVQKKEIEQLFEDLLIMNQERAIELAIDKALEDRDYEAFTTLTSEFC